MGDDFIPEDRTNWNNGVLYRLADKGSFDSTSLDDVQALQDRIKKIYNKYEDGTADSPFDNQKTRFSNYGVADASKEGPGNINDKDSNGNYIAGTRTGAGVLSIYSWTWYHQWLKLVQVPDDERA
jgi:hypothetical protein